MKNIFFVIILVVFCFRVNSQTGKSAAKTSPNAAQKKYSASETQNLVNTLKHDTCLDKKFSIVFYLIQDTANSLPNTPPNNVQSYNLNQIINLLNNTFSRICVSFEHCKTVIIPDHSHNRWKATINGNMITSTWYTDNTINVYIPEEIDPPYYESNEKTYAYEPGHPKNAIVIDRAAISTQNSANFYGSSILHAFGHFFGLPHTNAEINPSNIPSPPPPANATPPIQTLEYASRTNTLNCKEHGDGFCDTEADPFPSVLSVLPAIRSGDGSCSASVGLKDGMGTLYEPPTDNFMSLYGCRCRFSQEQYNYMAYIILTKRLYLH